MNLEWQEKYKIGNAEIDASQKALFALAQQIASSDDWMTLRPMIVALFKHMQTQFELEEALMKPGQLPWRAGPCPGPPESAGPPA